MNIYQAAKAGFEKVRKPEWEAGHFVDLRIDPETKTPNKWVHVHTPALPGHYGIDGYMDTVSAASFANDHDFVNADEQTPVVGQKATVTCGLLMGTTGTFVKTQNVGGMILMHELWVGDNTVGYSLLTTPAWIVYEPVPQSTKEPAEGIRQRVKFISGQWMDKTGTYVGLVDSGPGLHYMKLHKVMLDNDPCAFCLILDPTCFVEYEPKKQSKGDQVLVIGSRVEVIGGHWTGIVGTYAGLVEVDGLGGMMYHKVMLDDVNYCLVRPARFLKHIP